MAIVFERYVSGSQSRIVILLGDNLLGDTVPWFIETMVSASQRRPGQFWRPARGHRWHRSVLARGEGGRTPARHPIQEKAEKVAHQDGAY